MGCKACLQRLQSDYEISRGEDHQPREVDILKSARRLNPKVLPMTTQSKRVFHMYPHKHTFVSGFRDPSADPLMSRKAQFTCFWSTDQESYARSACDGRRLPADVRSISLTGARREFPANHERCIEASEAGHGVSELERTAAPLACDGRNVKRTTGALSSAAAEQGSSLMDPYH